MVYQATALAPRLVFYLLWKSVISSYHYNWAATDEHLIAIGKVVIESAFLEGILQLALWQIIEVPEEKGAYITGHLHLDGRIKLFQDVGREFFPKTSLCKLKKLISTIKQANTKRNLIVHGLWEPGKDSEPHRIHKYRRENNIYRRSYKDSTKISRQLQGKLQKLEKHSWLS